MRRRFSAHLLTIVAAAVLLAAALIAVVGGCGDSQARRATGRDAATERKLETLIALILDVERRGAGDEDSSAAQAKRIIAELGGPDSTAKILADRLLTDAERWIPILDSLSHKPRRAPAAAPSPAPTR